jgi:hypothetical protein
MYQPGRIMKKNCFALPNTPTYATLFSLLLLALLAFVTLCEQILSNGSRVENESDPYFALGAEDCASDKRLMPFGYKKVEMDFFQSDKIDRRKKIEFLSLKSN